MSSRNQPPDRTILRESNVAWEQLLKSAKSADMRHQSVKELADFLGGAPDAATVLRGFLKKQSLTAASGAMTALLLGGVAFHDAGNS